MIKPTIKSSFENEENHQKSSKMNSFIYRLISNRIHDGIELLEIFFYPITYFIILLSNITLPFRVLCQLCINTYYFFYITIPILFWSYLYTQILNTLIVFCRRNSQARKFIIHFSEIVKIGMYLYYSIIT